MRATNTMTHWLNSYIGKPYQRGCQGPDAFDCWGFVRWVLAHHYGHSRTTLEDLDALIALAPSYWAPLNHPHDGAIVMMEAANCPHVGVWVDTDHGGVAHCIENYGVIFSPLSTLPLLGCRIISFYRCSQSPQ